MSSKANEKALLSFSLVSLRVGLHTIYNGGDSDGNGLHWACPHCKGAHGVGELKKCKNPSCGHVFEAGEKVAWSRATEKGLVFFADAELKVLKEVGTGTLSIRSFVPVPLELSILSKNVWLLRPAEEKKGSDVPPEYKKAYAVLVDALASKHMAGLCTFTSRGKSHPALVVSITGCLFLHQLYYHDQIRFCEIAAAAEEDSIGLTEDERRLAGELVEINKEGADVLASIMDPFRARLAAAAAQKAEGMSVTVPLEGPAPTVAPMPDLFSQLKAIVDASKEKQKKTRAEEGEPAEATVVAAMGAEQ